MDIDTEQLRSLMQLLAKHGFDELEIERGEERILLRRGPAPSAPAAAPGPQAHGPPSASEPAPAPQSEPPAPAPAAAADSDPTVTHITSPFVGTFYRAPSPDAAPFVEVGQEVAPGQALCIVEAMKLMNEIECELHGAILEVLVENGTPVEYGDKLFKVRTKG